MGTTAYPVVSKYISTLTSTRGHTLMMEHIDVLPSLERAVSILSDSDVEEGNALLIKRMEGIDAYLPKKSFKNANTPFFFCVMLRPKIPPQKALSLSVLATVATCRVIRRFTGKNISVRWPNKIFSDGRCLGSVQLKGGLHPTDGTYQSVVISVAVALSDTMESHRLTKTVSRVFTGTFLGFRERFGQALLTEIFSLYEQMEKDKSFIEEYRALCLDKGAFIKLRSPRRRGTVRDVDSEGRLIVDFLKGGSTVLFSPEIIKRIYPIK